MAVLILCVAVPMRARAVCPDGLDGLHPLAPDPNRIDWRRSIVITSNAVVQDSDRTYTEFLATPGGTGTPGGKWTFSYLMGEALGTEAAQAVTDWMRHWTQSQSRSPETLPARLGVLPILVPWKVRSAPSPTLDLEKAPLRLLAIVNRLDLATRGNACAESGAELRFVYGLVVSDNGYPPVRGVKMTVILEYNACEAACDLAQTARNWIDLGTYTQGDETYNGRLEALTDRIVTRPNALKRIRTNELALATPGGSGPLPISPWDMRSFRVSDTGTLELAPLDQTPRGDSGGIRVNDQPLDPSAVGFINTSGATVVSGAYCMPDLLCGWRATSFPRLGDSGPSLGTYWVADRSGPVLTNAMARSAFSNATCNGCHSGETKTKAAHVRADIPPFQEAALSEFLEKASWTFKDPVDGTSRVTTEMDERRKALAALADSVCVDPDAP